eukprot:TRINITY_DN6610_c0_g1_i5.p2 TRINITY_DN6610_c0_g1~~TRINITY_DN6610_c0_g1_i5.p2  ORF type:complete len:227 (+),score=20.80 TRINITY_DN6610_c0_g1_i5:120-800(+)
MQLVGQRSQLPGFTKVSRNCDFRFGCLRKGNKMRSQLQIKNVAAEVTPATTVDQKDSVPVPELPFRVGHGFDLHRLAEGYKLIIGGIDIPHTKGCEAHSDGDVLLHCITDAILGALTLPDIGQLFPDNDPKWKGASSDIFVKEAVRLMNERGYIIGNVDCTIIAQKPKLSPHKERIRDNVAALLQAHPQVVNIKAKTHEKVDSIGEERSIACHTVISLVKQSVLQQ